MNKTSEFTLEQTTLDWFETLGWQTAFGPDISPDGAVWERQDYDQVVLLGRLQYALENINPNIPPDAIEEALRKITRSESPSLIENNRRFHRMLTDGVDVSYRQEGGEIHDKVWLLDLEDLENNDWLVVNQFTVIEECRNRRPDIVVFMNGLPLGVIELKNPADEKATIRHAYNQLQTYKAQVPSLFRANAVLVTTDGMQARIGSLTANMEWFKVWRTIDGQRDAAPGDVLGDDVDFAPNPLRPGDQCAKRNVGHVRKPGDPPRIARRPGARARMHLVVPTRRVGPSRRSPALQNASFATRT